MLMTSRTLWSDNGTLKDLSVLLGDFKTGSQVIDFVAAEDYLYLGSDFPFNHRYINVSAVNAATSSLVIELWDGTTWNAAEDIIDQTSVAGVTLATSGVVSWVPNDDDGWMRESTNDDGETITGLTSVKIRDLYWARFSFTNDLTNTTALKFIGHKFSNDNDLAIFYPDLIRSAVLAHFQAAKTSWNDQHIQAAEEIVKDLKKTKIIKSRNQILNWELFRDAACHKVAEIAFNAFGKDYFENRDAARAMYKEEMKKAFYHVDHDNDATLSVMERKVTEGKLYR